MPIPQPEWFATLQTDYTFQQVIGEADFVISGMAVYRGKTEVPGDTVGRFTTDSYTQLDFYAALRSPTWGLQLFVKNATDEDGVLEKRGVANLYNELTMIAPRTYGITASYRF